MLQGDPMTNPSSFYLFGKEILEEDKAKAFNLWKILITSKLSL